MGKHGWPITLWAEDGNETAWDRKRETLDTYKQSQSPAVCNLSPTIVQKRVRHGWPNPARTNLARVTRHRAQRKLHGAGATCDMTDICLAIITYKP